MWLAGIPRGESWERERVEEIARLLPGWAKNAGWVVSGVVMSLVAVPTLYLVVWAFWGTEVVGTLRPVGSPTTRWLVDVLSDAGWRQSLLYSTRVALGVSLAGTAANAFYNYFTRFSPSRLATFTFILLTSVLLNPLIPYAMSLRAAGVRLGLTESQVLAMGHFIVVLPLQYLVFEAATEQLPRDRLWAGRSLGAGHLRNFTYVYLPYSRLAIYSALAIGFFASFDELVVALFVIESSVVTVPLRLWQLVSQVARPDPAVVSCILLGALVLLLAGRRRALVARVMSPRDLLRHVESWWRETALGFLASLAVYRMLGGERSEGLLGQGLSALAAGTMGIAVGLAVALVKTRRAVGAVLAVLPKATPGLSGVDLRIGTQFVVKSTDLLDALRAGRELTLLQEDVADLSGACFRGLKGRYIGTDRHVPSRFYELYPGYLDRQLERADVPAYSDVRVLLYGEDDLARDVQTDPDAARRFISDHNAARRRLLAVPRALVQEAQAHLHLPSTDFGLFGGEFVVFFTPPETGIEPFRVTLRSLRDDALAMRIEDFLVGLVDGMAEVGEARGLPKLQALDAAGQMATRESLSRQTWRRRR